MAEIRVGNLVLTELPLIRSKLPNHMASPRVVGNHYSKINRKK